MRSDQGYDARLIFFFLLISLLYAYSLFGGLFVTCSSVRAIAFAGFYVGAYGGCWLSCAVFWGSSQRRFLRQFLCNRYCDCCHINILIHIILVITRVTVYIFL